MRQQMARSRHRQDGVRDLAEVLEKAESSRVLNLSQIAAAAGDDIDHDELPFFENRVLNRSIIMKAAAPTDDVVRFTKIASRVTKVIFPLDRNDLSLGGLYGLVGQKNFTDLMSRHLTGSQRLSERDERVLDMIDELPTLDPFLLYALLKSHRLEVARVYFQLSEADQNSIQKDMAVAFSPLVSLCFPNSGFEEERARVFIDKILNFEDSPEIEALRAAFRLEPDAFAMAMFAWRGIIYYKWKSQTLRAGLNRIIDKFARIRLVEQGGASNLRALEASRTKIVDMAKTAAASVQETIDRYDAVFLDFVRRREVDQFREFLMGASSLFLNCGQSVAVIEHTINFFESRADTGRGAAVATQEFAEMLIELQDELGLDFQVRRMIW
jgi:hypothetical protein